MKEKLKLLILKIKNSLLRVFLFGKGNTALKVLAPLALVLLFVLVPMQSAHAESLFGIGDWMADKAKGAILWFVGWIIGDVFIPLMGAIMMWITKGIVMVAGYNGFGTATAVTVGWVLLRDMANMIFVIALLMMAFGTMLDIESLGNSKQLPRLLVMAVAVNFSKMITLFLIDISQVVMLTFVAAFRATAAGNFVKAFGITDWFTKVANTEAATDQFTQTIIGMLLAAILTVVATGVLIVFLAFLVIRLVTLWMLIIFSPLAFGLSVLAKKGKSYYDKWWDELVKTLITGPLIAFFLWLTLATAGASTSIGTEIITNSRNVNATTSAEVGGISSEVMSPPGQHGTKALQLDVLITFVVSIAMLMLGLQITQEVGAAGIGKAMAVKDKVGKFAGGIAKKSALWAGKKAGGAAYNAKIPFAGGQSLAGLVAGAGAMAKNSGIGKTLGLNKEYTDLQRAERKVKGLRSFGQETEARKLEQATIEGHRKNLAPLTQNQVVDKLKAMRQKGETGSLEYKAMGLDLASRGFYKGNYSNIKKVAGGDADYEQDLIKEVNKNGGNYVDVKGGDPAAAVKDMMAGKSDSDLRSMFGDIEKGVKQTRDIDGNETTADPHAVEKLLNLEAGTYNNLNFGEQTKKKVDDALLLAMKNEKDPAKQQALVNKYNTLTGTGATASPNGDIIAGGRADAGARQKELFEGQQKGLTESYTSELRKGKGSVSDIDQVFSVTATGDGRNAMDAGDRKHIRQNLVPKLQGVVEAIKNSRSSVPHEQQAEGIEQEMRNLDRIYDEMKGDTGMVDKATGNKMSHRELLHESSLFKTMDEMAQTLRKRQAVDTSTDAGKKEADGLDKFIGALQQKMSTLSQDLKKTRYRGTGGARKNYEEVMKRIKNVDAQISSSMVSMRASSSESEKVGHMSVAREQIHETLGRLSSGNMNLAEPEKRAIRDLKQRAEELKRTLKSKTQPTSNKMAEIEKLARDFEQLRKNIK